MFPLILLAPFLQETCGRSLEDRYPLVETPFGKIEGLRTRAGNVTVDIFTGIRYAQPPVGEKRFQKPEMVKSWSEVLEAKTWGNSCHAFSDLRSPLAIYNEDCLVVNIIRPSTASSDKLPVLIFIHGGAFVGGDATSFGITVASENFVSQDIIYVTLQYRLGPLGFYATADGVVKGNNGMWDQTLALEFLRKILPSFGGDVDRITISGQSAGSASVSALLYSPHSQNLFNQSIQLSGSSFGEWAMSNNLVKTSTTFAKEVGCDQGSSQDLLKCLQSLSVDKMIQTVAKFDSLAEWGPHEDGDFFPKSILELANEAPKKVNIQGVCNGETIGFALAGGVGNKFVVPEGYWKDFNVNDLRQKLDETLFATYDFGKKNVTLRQLVADYYMEPNTTDYYFLRQYVNSFADFLFVVPTAQEIRLKTENGWPTYYYVNDYTSPVLNSFGLFPVTYPIEGALHAMELRVIFGMEILELLPLGANDQKFKKNYVEAFVAFAKTGNPSTPRIPWLPTSIAHPFRHLRMNPSPSEDYEFQPDAFNFWNREVPLRIGAQLLRDTLFPGTSLN